MREKQLGFAFKAYLPRVKSEDQQKTEKILMDEMQESSNVTPPKRLWSKPLDRNGNRDYD